MQYVKRSCKDRLRLLQVPSLVEGIPCGVTFCWNKGNDVSWGTDRASRRGVT